MAKVFKVTPKRINHPESQLHAGRFRLGAPRIKKNSSFLTTCRALASRCASFASNNTFWDRDDNRRGMLQEEALTFLMKQRDIKNYKDVFNG